LPIVPIRDAIRKAVRERAQGLCEYCHSPERSSSDVFTIEHTTPRSLGGSDELSNLALACRRCNERRYNFMTGIDPITQAEVPLFNPRTQQWSDHFVWSRDGCEVLGTTAIGRATSNRLDINDRQHNEGFIRDARQLWIQGGWHPPDNDPHQS
jgi:hypothetical protein